MTTPLRPRVLLADDYEPSLAAWRHLLEPACEVVIVADLAMPEMNGLDACREIRNAATTSRIVIVTASGDEWVARAAFRAGASAFVLKHSAAKDLLTAVRTRFHGGTYCTPALGVDLSESHPEPV